LSVSHGSLLSLATTQMLMLPSAADEARALPSGLNAMLLGWPLFPLKLLMSRPRCAFQMQTV
jgi:hypothetical protein